MFPLWVVAVYLCVCFGALSKLEILSGVFAFMAVISSKFLWSLTDTSCSEIPLFKLLFFQVYFFDCSFVVECFRCICVWPYLSLIFSFPEYSKGFYETALTNTNTEFHDCTWQAPPSIPSIPGMEIITRPPSVQSKITPKFVLRVKKQGAWSPPVSGDK